MVCYCLCSIRRGIGLHHYTECSRVHGGSLLVHGIAGVAVYHKKIGRLLVTVAQDGSEAEWISGSFAK